MTAGSLGPIPGTNAYDEAKEEARLKGMGIEGQGYIGDSETENQIRIPDKNGNFGDLKYYSRTDDTGGDKGTIQVWSIDNSIDPDTGLPRNKTKHIGNYYKADGYQKFDPNDEWYRSGTGTKVSKEEYERFTNKDNAILMKDASKEAVKRKTNADCKAKTGKPCAEEAQKKADDVGLDAEQTKALEDAAKNQKDTEGETVQKKDEAMSDHIDNAHQRAEYEDIVYPIDLNPEYQDFIQFQMIEYQPRKFKSAAKAGALGSRMAPGIQTVKVKGGTGNAIRGISGVNTNDYGKQKNGERKILATMTLPIPAGIADQNSVNWGEKSLSQLDQQLASSAGEITSGTGVGAGEASNKAQIGATGTAVQVGLINAALSGADFAQRQYGATLNKNMELLFNGPKLRGFNFTFRLSPRSADEAAAVKAMIRQFKQGMSPKKGKTFTFIKAPHTFFIGYYHKGSTSPWLNMFKECALESMSMSYTPDGQYSTFHDGALTSYQMQLSFKELEPVFDSDYDDLSKGQGASGIGANEYIGY